MRQARKQANPGLGPIARDAGLHDLAAALGDAISFHALRFYLCGFIHQPPVLPVRLRLTNADT
jgi:hypothetical protein